MDEEFDSNLKFKLNDREFPEYTNPNTLLARMGLYSFASTIGGYYLYKNYHLAISGNFNFKLLVFPLSSFLFIINMRIYEDLQAHMNKYPELYPEKNS